MTNPAWMILGLFAGIYLIIMGAKDKAKHWPKLVLGGLILGVWILKLAQYL